MPPSAPIDASLSPVNGIYWVLEKESIWKTENLGGGSASWTEAYTAGSFESANGCSGCQFLRVISSSDDLVDVLAAAKASGESTYTAYHLRSNNRGVTWNAHEIEDGIEALDYTVTHQVSAVVTYAGSALDLPMIHPRIGDDETEYNPWAIAWQIVTTPAGDGWGNLNGSTDTIHDFSASSVDPSGGIWGNGNWLLGGSGAAGEAYLTDYFGGGGWSRAPGIDRNMPEASGRVKVVPNWEHSTNGYTAYSESWVFWNVPSPNMPKAMAVSPTNNSWIYVGLRDKIMASENGGVDWFEFYGSHGANDLCVDPQLAGAVYYWATTGSLNLLVKQTLGAAGVLTSTALMTESALDAFGRVARDPSSGRLLAIPNGTILKMRNLAVNTELQTGLVMGCGLHIYPGQKMICCDMANIYISDNLHTTPPTVSLKKGGWAAYASGVNAHRMTTP